MAPTDDGPTTFTLPPTLKFDDAASLTPHITPLTHPSAPQTLTSLSLTGTTLGVPAATALSDHLRTLTSLRTANLSDIFTGRLLNEIPPALDALLSALLSLPNLHTVDLSDNAFGLSTQAPLVKFLERHTPLRHLILNNNGLGPKAGVLVGDALTRLAEAKEKAKGLALASVGAAAADGVRRGDESAGAAAGEEAARNLDLEAVAPPLETIVCGRNRLENGSMGAWSVAVAAHARGLTEVRMVQNGIRQEGIQMLLRQGLSKAGKLERLDLQDNTFTRSGAKALSEVVVGWARLRDLGVGDCLLSARGAVLLGEALAQGKNDRLEVLRLQYNDIDARGISAIVKACEAKALPRLRRVEVNGNKFAEEDPAVEKLREILEGRRDAAVAEGVSAGAEAGEGRAIEDEEWGLDELDDLEEEDSDEEEGAAGEESEAESESEEEEEEKKEERDLKQADEAEKENVALQKDKEVDDLADQLGKTGI